jgi:hypothetical protein
MSFKLQKKGRNSTFKKLKKVDTRLYLGKMFDIFSKHKNVLTYRYKII